MRCAGAALVLHPEANVHWQEIRGAVYYPRWAPAARMLQRIDPLLGRWCTIGAAFIAMRAVKRAGPTQGSN